MFRKLVSNLSFSPALVGQLGFYAKRLRKEETTRRLGLIFTALALIVQSFTMLQAPEPASAADATDMVYGGTHTPSAVMSSYDQNVNNIRDLYTAIGISRADIQRATGNLEYHRSSEGLYSWGMKPVFGASSGEGSYTVKTSGGTRTFYYRPQRLWGNSGSYSAYVGRSSSTGLWFGIMRSCGNLITFTIPPRPACPPGQVGTYPNCSTPPKNPTSTCSALDIKKNGDTYQFTGSGVVTDGATISKYIFQVYRDNTLVKTIESSSSVATYTEKTPGSYSVKLTIKTSLGDRTSAGCTKGFTIAPPAKCPQNPALLKTDPNCQPCPGDSTIWINDTKCNAEIIQTKTAQNTSQNNTDATTIAAKATDQIVYKINVTNKGLKATEYTIKEDLADVLQYASLENTGGGTLTDDNSSDAIATKTLLTWPKVTLKPGETQTRIFSVKLASTIAAKGAGTGNPNSYDCVMTNTFGNTVNINVDCPVQKKVESVVAQLPHTGLNENIAFAAIIFAVVTFFYARSRQLKKEVRLIRRDFNTGTI